MREALRGKKKAPAKANKRGYRGESPVERNLGQGPNNIYTKLERHVGRLTRISPNRGYFVHPPSSHKLNPYLRKRYGYCGGTCLIQTKFFILLHYPSIFSNMERKERKVEPLIVMEVLSCSMDKSCPSRFKSFLPIGEI